MPAAVATVPSMPLAPRLAKAGPPVPLGAAWRLRSRTGMLLAATSACSDGISSVRRAATSGSVSASDSCTWACTTAPARSLAPAQSSRHVVPLGPSSSRATSASTAAGTAASTWCVTRWSGSMRDGSGRTTAQTSGRYRGGRDAAASTRTAPRPAERPVADGPPGRPPRSAPGPRTAPAPAAPSRPDEDAT